MRITTRLARLIGESVFGGDRAKRRRRAKNLARTMISELARLGFYEQPKKGPSRRVRFSPPLLVTQDELWAPIDLVRFPARKTTSDLREEKNLISLSERCNTPIRVDTLANGKVCLVARIRGVAFPASFSINDFKMPVDAPVLAFPLGINSEGEHQWADLAEVKHLLVAGATGGGKTTFMHTMLYSFVTRNSAELLELWLIDLKGQEFSKYDKLTGTKTRPGIVRHSADNPEDALSVLDNAVKEIKRRNDLMKKFDASNLKDLAHLSGQHLRRVVIAIDEVAVLTLDRAKVAGHTVGSWAQHLITQIAALGRAAGVHAVVATQHINKEVLTGLILANFESRVCFSVADWRKSHLIIETTQADSIPTGRMFWRHIGRTVEYQAPLITPAQLRLELGRVAAHGPYGGLGEQEETARFVRNAKLVIQVASTEFSGQCAIKKLLHSEGIRGVITQEVLQETCQRLEQDGILEPGRSNRPRKVSRGYMHRPDLIEAHYIPTGASQDASQDASWFPGCSENQPDDASHITAHESQQQEQNTYRPASRDLPQLTPMEREQVIELAPDEYEVEYIR
jgi:energy-coupling factor transporter ATP-binding protein EcfA2